MKKFCSFLVLLLVLNSCGNYVSVKVMRPAEISTAQYKKVAIGNVFANNSRYGEVDKLRTLLTSELQKKNYFQIIDTRMGIPAGNDLIVINSNILTSTYNEDVTVGDEYKDKNGKPHRDHQRNGKHTLSVQYRLTTVNGVIAGEKSTQSEDEKSTTETDKAPPSINVDELVLENVLNSVNEFLRSIIPYEERISIELKDDESMPNLKKGIEAAENGFWDLAVSHFSKEAKASSNPLVHYAYYNLGVVYLYSYDFEKARINLRKALEMKGNEGAYKRMYAELDRMERDEIKLKEQRK